MSSNNKLGLDTATWTYRFKADGRSYTLSKRNKSADGFWQLDVVIKRRRIIRSLETNDAKLAVERAVNEYIRPARAERWEHLAKSRANDNTATLGAILDCYDQLAPGLVKPKTQAGSQKALALVVRRGLGDDKMTLAAVRDVSSSKLTGKLVADFAEWQTKLALSLGRDLESNKRSIRSFLRQARGIFNKQFLQCYPEKGLVLPDLTEFLQRKTAKPARLSTLAPSRDLIARTAEGVAGLRTFDPEMFVVLLCALYSLRLGEIDRMTFDWMIQPEGDGDWVVRVPASVAKSKVDRDVPVPAEFVAELTRWRGERAESDYLLEAKYPTGKGRTYTLRCDGTFKRSNAWLRAMGWRGRKGLHALRASYLKMIRRIFGLDKTQGIAGHQDSRTTEIYTGGPDAGGAFIPFEKLVKASNQ